MTGWKDDLLVALLDCGYADVYILEGCEYDMGEIVERCESNFGKLDINLLCITMFERGMDDIVTFVTDRICELEAIGNERDLDEEEQMELDALSELAPYEDIESFHNYIDTSIWVAQHNETYELYCKEALQEFEEMTGYCISNGWH